MIDSIEADVKAILTMKSLDEIEDNLTRLAHEYDIPVQREDFVASFLKAVGPKLSANGDDRSLAAYTLGQVVVYFTELDSAPFFAALKLIAQAEIAANGLVGAFLTDSFEEKISFANRGALEAWFYEILENISDYESDDGFVDFFFVAHEYLFSCEHHDRLVKLGHHWTAALLKDDLLMHSEKIMRECAEKLAMPVGDLPREFEDHRAFFKELVRQAQNNREVIDDLKFVAELILPE